MLEGKRRNPVLASLSVLCAAALVGLPLLQVAPNRLVSGQPVYFFSMPHSPAWLLAAMLLTLLVAWAVAGLARPARVWCVTVLMTASALLAALLWLAAGQASASLQGASPLARVSLGGAFWAATVLLGFIVTSALQQLHATALGTAGVCAVLLLVLAAMLASGVCDDLSLMKEFANRADSFVQVLARHLEIVLVSLAFTLAIGLPLAWAAYAKPSVGRLVFPVLNIIQTIPSIALFGLLMLPLALLAARVPAIGQAGISGVGLAPAVIALMLYGLLPVVRSTLTGLQQVPSAMANAAFALGLTRGQVLTAIELPLALPVMLVGVRTAAVSSVGLAAVSALIGAGGLGGILFEGLFANAQDVVLLGVLPIIALGVLFDAFFKLLSAWARRRARLQ